MQSCIGHSVRPYLMALGVVHLFSFNLDGYLVSKDRMHKMFRSRVFNYINYIELFRIWIILKLLSKILGKKNPKQPGGFYSQSSETALAQCQKFYIICAEEIKTKDPLIISPPESSHKRPNSEDFVIFLLKFICLVP